MLAYGAAVISRLAVQNYYQTSYLSFFFRSLHNVASTDNVDYFERLEKEATLFIYVILEFSWWGGEGKTRKISEYPFMGVEI